MDSKVSFRWSKRPKRGERDSPTYFRPPPLKETLSLSNGNFVFDHAPNKDLYQKSAKLYTQIKRYGLKRVFWKWKIKRFWVIIHPNISCPSKFQLIQTATIVRKICTKNQPNCTLRLKDMGFFWKWKIKRFWVIIHPNISCPSKFQLILTATIVRKICTKNQPNCTLRLKDIG